MNGPDIVVYEHGRPWSASNEEAFAAGLARHGIVADRRRKGDWRDCDLAVVWGHADTHLHARQRAHGGHYLVMERGFVGDIDARRRWTALGFDGLNGRGRRPAGMPADRWKRHFAGALQEWRPAAGGYALLIGQVPGDAALAGMSISGWLQEQTRALLARGHEVRFRPHPQVTPPARSLADDLAGAALVVTYNSNTGVDAVLAGVPAVTMDAGAMAWPVTVHDLDAPPARPDRMQWAADLAWAQWRPDEIAAGDAWAALAPVLAGL